MFRNNQTFLFLEPVSFADNEYLFHADPLNAVESIDVDNGRTRRHVLYRLVIRPLTHFVEIAFGIGREQSIRISSILISVLSVLIAYYALNKFTRRPEISFLLTLLYGFAFSNLIMFSIPEIYALSSLTISIYVVSLIRLSSSPTIGKAAITFVTVGIAGLANPPLMLLADTVAAVVKSGIPIPKEGSSGNGVGPGRSGIGINKSFRNGLRKSSNFNRANSINISLTISLNEL